MQSDFSKFSIAVRTGNLEIVKKMFNKETDFYSIAKYRSAMDFFAIPTAAKNNHVDVIKYLFENGAPFSAFVINMAVESGNFEMVRYLFENKAPIDENAINYASIYGYIEIVKYLFENGAPTNHDLLRIPVVYNKKDIVIFLLLKGIHKIDPFYYYVVVDIDVDQNDYYRDTEKLHSIAKDLKSDLIKMIPIIHDLSGMIVEYLL